MEEIKMKYTYKYIYQENLDETGVFLFYSLLTSYLLIPKPFSHLILWLCKCIFLEVYSRVINVRGQDISWLKGQNNFHNFTFSDNHTT